MSSPVRIVVGIDFTPTCRAALQQALRLAAGDGAVIAVHVIDTLVVSDLQEALPERAETLCAEIIADAQRLWREFSAAVPGAAAVRFEVGVNNRAAGILAAARAHGAELLVLGAGGRRGPEVGVGTVASACVRRGPADVLIVRGEQAGPFRRIVACVDFSETSRRALQRAAELAVRDGAALEVVHVFDAPWRQLHYRAPTLEAEPQFEAQYRRTLSARLEGFVAESGADVQAARPVCALCDCSGHRSGIVEYAQRAGAELIALGARGRTNLRDVLLGSTAEKALRETQCSVLAVKPVEAAAATDESTAETAAPSAPLQPRI